MTYQRKDRMGEMIKRIVSDVIRQEVKDPRVSQLSSVTHVDVTKDMRFATIYVSLFDPNHSMEDHLAGLRQAKGFIRKKIGAEISAHYTPEPIFKEDETIAESNKINAMLAKIKKEKS